MQKVFVNICIIFWLKIFTTSQTHKRKVLSWSTVGTMRALHTFPQSPPKRQSRHENCQLLRIAKRWKKLNTHMISHSHLTAQQLSHRELFTLYTLRCSKKAGLITRAIQASALDLSTQNLTLLHPQLAAQKWNFFLDSDCQVDIGAFLQTLSEDSSLSFCLS